MIKLTNPLNKDGVLYSVGHTLTLEVEREEALIKNGLAEPVDANNIETIERGEAIENSLVESVNTAITEDIKRVDKSAKK